MNEEGKNLLYFLRQNPVNVMEIPVPFGLQFKNAIPKNGFQYFTNLGFHQVLLTQTNLL